MAFENVYQDAARADAYSRLEFPGTYSLAFRDLPGLLAKHVSGRRAVDFGCGAGRSTRFLRTLGFEVIGVQGISTESEAGLNRIGELVDVLVSRKPFQVHVWVDRATNAAHAIPDGIRTALERIKA